MDPRLQIETARFRLFDPSHHGQELACSFSLSQRNITTKKESTMRKAALTLFILLAFVACDTEPVVTDTAPATDRSTTTPADDPDAARADVDQIRSQWLDAADRDDAATVTALYSDDAVVSSPEGSAEGREAIEELWTQQFPMSSDLDVEAEDFASSGDLAYEIGRYSQTLTPPEGEPMEVDGKYVIVLKRQPDGAWRIVRHMSFINEPDQEGATPRS